MANNGTLVSKDGKIYSCPIESGEMHSAYCKKHRPDFSNLTLQYRIYRLVQEVFPLREIGLLEVRGHSFSS